MRRALIGFITFGLVACNAILGNEDQYTLVPGAAGAGKAGNANKAGASGKAGNPATGDGGMAGVGDEAGSGGAGEAGDGGSPSGAAGGGSCVATGAEDCFNGKDDDCNGETDCGDSACTATSTCVPDATGGAELGTLLPLMGTTCPTGYSAVTLHRGLTVDPACTGCTCQVASSICVTSIVGHGTFECESFSTSGLSYNMNSTSCQPVNPGTSTHTYAVASFTDCTASGTAKPSAVQWGETRTFCKADRVGRGCTSGSSCVPKAASTACTRKTGSTTCSGSYAVSSGEVWNSGVTDSRTCAACQCAGGYGTCTNPTVQLYSTVGCNTNPVTIPGTEGNQCPLPFAPLSGRVTGTPVPTMCLANVYPSGEVTAVGPSTVCCR